MANLSNELWGLVFLELLKYAFPPPADPLHSEMVASQRGQPNGETQSVPVEQIFVALKNIVCVSSQWRNIVIKTPYLWSESTINLARIGDAMMREILERSGGLPISVFLDEMDLRLNTDIKSVLTVIIDNADRIKGVRLHTAESILNSILPDVFKHLTSITSLSIEITSLDLPGGPHELASSTSGPMPALRRLYFTNFILPWHSSIFSGLVELRICLHSGLGTTLPPLTLPPLDLFISILQRLPNLVILRLDGATPFYPPTEFEALEEYEKLVLEFPHLRQLQGAFFRLNPVVLLRHMHTPATLSLSFVFRIIHAQLSPFGDWRPLSYIIPPNPSCLLSLTGRRLSFISMGYESQRMLIKGWRGCSGGEIHGGDDDAPPCLYLELGRVGRVHSLSCSVKEIGQTLDSSALEILTLWRVDRDLILEWPTILRALVSLQALFARLNDFAPLFEALREEVVDGLHRRGTTYRFTGHSFERAQGPRLWLGEIRHSAL